MFLYRIITILLTVGGLGAYFSSDLYDDYLLDIRIKSMSLEEKIGRMMMVSLDGVEVDDAMSDFIDGYNIGAVNLLGRNVINKSQVKDFISDLKNISKISGAEPLLVAVDQEGGAVSRFSFLHEMTPQNNIKSNERAYSVALNRGMELRELGVDMNFAPVLDFVTDKSAYLYNRAFIGNLQTVHGLGGYMIKGYRDAGVIAVPKHYPGYGDIKTNPHINRAGALTAAEYKNSTEIFIRIIADYRPEILMTAHIITPETDGKPFTISGKAIEALRSSGFDGVIISDDMGMSAVGEDPILASKEAIRAGINMLIISNDRSAQIDIYKALLDAVRSGEIGEESINNSTGKILRLKDYIKSLSRL